MVIPTELARTLKGQPDRLESYEQPLPFISEVWSPSTGDCDATGKLDEYRARGDREIWLVHPYEQTVHAWRLARGHCAARYAESVHGPGGTVELSSLPGVVVDLDKLFDQP